jgi:hypothetical protein
VARPRPSPSTWPSVAATSTPPVTSANPPSLWTAYGVIFALTTGANVINVDGEIIAYGVLDV